MGTSKEIQFDLLMPGKKNRMTIRPSQQTVHNRKKIEMCIYCRHGVTTVSHDQFDVKAMIYAFMIDKKIGQKITPDDKPSLRRGCLFLSSNCKPL